ncbi:hypothetical protein HMP09_1919 [Sphingomonas sp. HMP9]|uniref:ParB N-terminal domain-containing protein n=1 Tax=Sphingomonas sp. HMP9 TaxID=1517554 RepID=UPI001596B0C9|nr:ParB N-terminal domain-containing protein [Sphingomonas sp. HMP9]BCA62685.1 hypothetical protein HMP09_1919 [Sphingomonas sp. HMP9]
MSSSSHSGVITLRGNDIPTVTRDIEQSKLRFYADNPRIYSLVRSDGHEPDQQLILEKLLEHDHVHVLKDDIVANGGLIDPLIVRDGDMVVLEGNSRLAAYRHLAGKEPIRWGRVRCTVLPADMDEQLIFTLLGQYHVKGKTDWAPFEKAGFIHRRITEQALEIDAVAEDLSIRKSEAEQLVRVFRFMLDKKVAARDHWSYFDEYLKSRKISKARELHPELDDVFVSHVDAGVIPRAIEVRTKLAVICGGNPKNLKRYVQGIVGFEDAYETASVAGGDNVSLAKLRRFRQWIVQNDSEDDMREATKAVRDKMRFELKEIERRTKKLKELLGG